MAISNTSGFIQLNNSLPHFLLLYLKFFFLLNSVKGLVREPPMNTRYILLNVFDDALLSSKIAVVNKRIYAMAHTSLSQPEIRYFVYYECQQSQISAIPPLNHLSIFSSFFFFLFPISLESIWWFWLNGTYVLGSGIHVVNVFSRLLWTVKRRIIISLENV